MFSAFIHSIKETVNRSPSIKILFKEPPKPLGRWSLGDKKKQEINGILQNIDSCGDRLCGDVNSIKNTIDKISNKIK